MTLTEEHKKKISLTMRGNKNALGKKYSEETRRKMSLARKGKKNPSWMGGIQFTPYTLDFNEEFKMLIRKRDGFKCKVCSAPAILTHHIDYDKSNNNPDNIVTICRVCHGKTNYNREYWIKFFKGVL